MKNKRDFPNRHNEDFHLWHHVFVECTLFRTGFEFYFHLVSRSREGPFPDPGKSLSQQQGKGWDGQRACTENGEEEGRRCGLQQEGAKRKG